MGELGIGIPYNYDWNAPKTRTIPGIPEPMPIQDEPLDEPTDLTLADVMDEPSPMDLGQRQMGLGQFMNEMPTSRKSDWEDYLAYVQRLGDMPGGHLEYDEWHDMMRRRR